MFISKNNTDDFFMKKALSLAEKGRGGTGANPLVGAIVVKNGEIIGSGYHRQFGGAHAEVFALNEAGINAEGADLYVSLEPCSHFGKTPPCTENIIKHRIKRVIIAVLDPHPLVSGKGYSRLKEAGIIVIEGILEKEAKRQNEAYFFSIKHERPFVAIKAAVSLDGRIADARGQSRWITGKESRKFVHRLRASSDAVLIGSGTALMDNPQLNTRYCSDSLSQPQRIVLDASLRIPLSSRLIQSSREQSLIIFCSSDISIKKIRERESAGVRVIPLSTSTTASLSKENTISSNDQNKKTQTKLNSVISSVGKSNPHFDLTQVLTVLGKMGIRSLLVEGGSQIFSSFIRENLVQKYYWFTAPLLLGNGGIPAVNTSLAANIYKTLRFNRCEWKIFGRDALLIAYPGACSCLPE